MPLTRINLRATVIARWWRRLADDPRGASHWRTKTAYYQAVSDLLGAGVPTLTWHMVVASVRPGGSRSTFYEVAGGHARHPMVRSLTDDGGLDPMQIALYYRRSAAIDQLVDETKVWSYWADRERLVRRCEVEPIPAESMARAVVEAVAGWAGQHPALAAALDYAPPACAVEDLMAAMSGRLPAVRAMQLLAEAAWAANAHPNPTGA